MWKRLSEIFSQQSAQKSKKGGEIVHLKIHFENEEGFLKESLVSQGGDIDFTGKMPQSSHKGNLSINARIKLEPSSVTRCITEALDETRRTYRIVLAEWDAHCFSPPPPEPYYRILSGE